MKTSFLLTISFLVLSCYAFSQGLPRDYVPELRDNSIQRLPLNLYRVGAVKGTTQTKPGFLPKLEYPREAIANDAEGEVRVQVAIDEEGTVTSASASTGHPALRAYCQEVAKRTKFRILRIDGQTVKTTGELVYLFEIEKAGWARVGADLQRLETASTLRYFPVAPITKSFGPDWADEREMLGKIFAMKMDELKKFPDEPAANRPVLQRTNSTATNGSFMITTIDSRNLIIPNPPTPERSAISRRLIASIRTRLAKDELALWQFDLGVGLNPVFSRDSDAAGKFAEQIRELVRRAPKDVSSTILADMRTVAAKIEARSRSADDFKEVPRLINVIIDSN